MDYGCDTGIHGSGTNAESKGAQASEERQEIHTSTLAGTVKPVTFDSSQSQYSLKFSTSDAELVADALLEDFTSPVLPIVSPLKRLRSPDSRQKAGRLIKPSQPELPTKRDHTIDQLNADGDEYIPREFDAAGERKVSLTGHLQAGREYRCRTFRVQDRGDKLFMLAVECARTLGYLNSFIFFEKNRSLWRIVADQNEKDYLAAKEILSSSDRSLEIAIVTARSVFPDQKRPGGIAVRPNLKNSSASDSRPPPLRCQFCRRLHSTGDTLKRHLQRGDCPGQGHGIAPGVAHHENVSQELFSTSTYDHGSLIEETYIQTKLEHQSRAHENIRDAELAIQNILYGSWTSTSSRYSSPEEGKDQDIWSSAVKISSRSTGLNSVRILKESNLPFHQSPSRHPPQELKEPRSRSSASSAHSNASDRLDRSPYGSRLAQFAEQVINSRKASGFDSPSQSQQKLHQPPPPLPPSQRLVRPNQRSDTINSSVEEQQREGNSKSRTSRERISSPPLNFDDASDRRSFRASYPSSISQEEMERENEAEDRQPEEWTPKGVAAKDAAQLINSVATRPSESGSDSDTGSGLECWWDWDFPGSAAADMKAQTIKFLIARFNSDYSSFGDFFASIQPCHQHATGPQANEPEPSKGSRHPSNATGRQCDKGKRKTLHEDDLNEDKDEEDGNDDDERRRKRSLGAHNETEGEERLLACPFYKKDPFRHRACARKVLKAVSRVKYHLLRCHQQPIHCDRCSTTFDCEHDRVAHARMTVPCAVETVIKWDAIDEDQKRQLSRRISSKQSERDQWFGIYAILFPDAENVPESPYLDRLESRLLRQLVTYAEVEGKGIVDELMVSLPESLRLVQLDIAAFLDSATQDFISRLFEKWETAARITSSKGGTTTLPLIPSEGSSIAAATATTTNVLGVHADTQPFNTTQSSPLQPVVTVPATAAAPQFWDFGEPLEMVDFNVPGSASTPLNDYHAHAGPSNSEQWALNNTSPLRSSQFVDLDLLPNAPSDWPGLLSITEPSSTYQYNRMAAGKAAQE
ncbi:MAG: hypothetical protein Q9165_007817 [Trypethelium subeluteriae]